MHRMKGHERTWKLTVDKDRRGIVLYIEYQSVCPLVRIGFPPAPPPPKASLSRSLPPWSHNPLRVTWGGGGASSDDWKEGLALCILCDKDEFSM